MTCESAVGYLNDVYVVYYDYKFTTFYDLLHHVIPQYNTIKEKTHTFYSNVPSTWRKIDYEQTGSGDQSAFEYNKDYDKENKNESAIKIFDLIKDQILDAYGGTLYFIYYPENGDYKIRCGYYGFEDLWHGFDYSVSYNVMPHYGLEIETPRYYPRFSIDENALLFCLHNDQKNYWNTLFNLITKKSELKKITEPNENENNNNENKKQTFNKDDIIKEIENYLMENPDEVDEMWEKFKDNKIRISNNDNNNNHTENSERHSLNIKKIDSNEINKTMNRPISPQKGKKNIIKIGNQKLNFSIGVSENRRHQSIFGQIKKVKKIIL